MDVTLSRYARTAGATMLSNRQIPFFASLIDGHYHHDSSEAVSDRENDAEFLMDEKIAMKIASW